MVTDEGKGLMICRRTVPPVSCEPAPSIHVSCATFNKKQQMIKYVHRLYSAEKNHKNPKALIISATRSQTCAAKGRLQPCRRWPRKPKGQRICQLLNVTPRGYKTLSGSTRPHIKPHRCLNGGEPSLLPIGPCSGTWARLRDSRTTLMGTETAGRWSCSRCSRWVEMSAARCESSPCFVSVSRVCATQR